MNQVAAIDAFDDIRPYRDSEVGAVLRRLATDRELVDTLMSIRFPRLKPHWQRVARPLIRFRLRSQFRRIDSVDAFQALIGVHLTTLMARVSTGVTVSGIDRLKRDCAYLFVSNHRDIAMDPAIVNLVLHQRQMQTVRIAIGDNLLTKPFVSDLMRLNKSFIVKRSVSGRREKLAALKRLSAYIRHSVLEDNCSVWIAQREGRAKDGVDRTETALLKMLALSRAPDQDFAAAMRALRLVPVAISYEFDPCDADKTRELFARRAHGTYQKLEHEDLTSIYKGVVGVKGHIHVAFGEVIDEVPADDEQLAAVVDRTIIANYHLQPTHVLAWEMLYGVDDRVSAWKRALAVRDWHLCENALAARLDGIPEEQREIFLEMYANPVSSRLALAV